MAVGDVCVINWINILNIVYHFSDHLILTSVHCVYYIVPNKVVWGWVSLGSKAEHAQNKSRQHILLCVSVHFGVQMEDTEEWTVLSSPFAVKLCPVCRWEAWWGEDVWPPYPSRQIPRPRHRHPADPEDRQHSHRQTRSLGKLLSQVTLNLLGTTMH